MRMSFTFCPHKALGTSVESTKERDSAIKDMKVTLTGVARTRDAVNSALSEASESIRSALMLQVGMLKSCWATKQSIPLQKSVASLDEEESADAKTRREDVLNQLMTLLNTAYTASKRTEAEEAADVGERPKARISTQQPQQVWSSKRALVH